MRSRGLLSVVLLIGLAGCTDTVVVQGPPPPPPAPVYATEPPPPSPAELSPLEQLCAPIALYPDPVVSLLLPASTFPDQIQQAAAYLQGGGDPAGVDAQPWDDSVRGLSHYPSVVQWMGANVNWTTQLGGAFANSPAAVMDAIQDLRRRAQAAGTLANTAQQQVVVYQNTVQIMPAQPDVIYVPQYDPAVVYVRQPVGYDTAVFFGWGRPYRTGVWLNYDFDWRAHAVYTGDWYHYRQEHGGYGRPIDYSRVNVNVRIDNSRHTTVINNFNARGWQPPHNAPPPPQQSRFVQPRVMAGAPRPPSAAVRVHAIEQNRPGARPPGRPVNAPANRPQPPNRPPQNRPESLARPPSPGQSQNQPHGQPRPETQPQPGNEHRLNSEAQHPGQHPTPHGTPAQQHKPQPKKPAPKKTPPRKEPEHADHPDHPDHPDQPHQQE